MDCVLVPEVLAVVSILALLVLTVVWGAASIPERPEQDDVEVVFYVTDVSHLDSLLETASNVYPFPVFFAEVDGYLAVCRRKDTVSDAVSQEG